jgi:hypothetical protein
VIGFLEGNCESKDPRGLKPTLPVKDLGSGRKVNILTVNRTWQTRIAQEGRGILGGFIWLVISALFAGFAAARA